MRHRRILWDVEKRWGREIRKSMGIWMARGVEPGKALQKAVNREKRSLTTAIIKTNSL
ncbi:MAG: hypothetical protein ACLFVI_04350 [Archaeoglobaceae archaeon]